MSGIDGVLPGLARHRPRRLPGRRRLGRAAVAVVLDDQSEAGPYVLLARRAPRRGDPWSGDLALPGGRQAPGDADNLACALRETREEVGLDLARGDCLGRLSDRITRSHRHPLPMAVTPYVFRLPATAPPLCCNAEIAETLWWPLAFLADRRNRRRMRWQVGPLPVPLPCYDYRGRRLWGLTLLMLDELLRLQR